jgi:hypothetical protein
MSELERVRERVRQARAARTRELAAAPPSPASAEQRLGCAFCVGDVVFDRVTGEVGEVVYGTRENVVVPTAER